MDYIIYFIITIAILVFVHEFGHFAAAKLCGMRADVFAIGFGKRLFGYNKKTGFTFGDLPKDFDGEGNTDYRLCLLPLGGYVKIAGMVDESFDTKFEGQEPKPYEFRSKPTYQKVFVITAGVLMNLLLAWVVFWGINYFEGKQVIKTTTIGYVEQGSLADSLGFVYGDRIVTVNGKEVNDWHELNAQIFINTLGENLRLEVEREGSITTVNIPREKLPETDSEMQDPIIYPDLGKPIIKEVVADSPAEQAGFKAGDEIIALNEVHLYSRIHAIKIIQANKGNEIPAKVLRDNDTVAMAVTPSAEGMIGVHIADNNSTDLIEFRTFGFFASFAHGWNDVVRITKLTFSMVGKVFKGDLEFGKAFGGPVKIAQYAADSADRGIVNFLFFLALLSLSLAIINIMPFPVLDGGHLIIILVEGAMKREIPVRVKVAIQNAGFVILLLLMAFIVYNDILNL
jgi:regulator of sigma E protease